MRLAPWLAVALIIGETTACQAPKAAILRRSGPSEHRFEVPDVQGMRWYRGNTHTHTLESDGDSSPEYVARWYKDHGYSFLVLSDHNVLTDPATLAHLVDSTFILIPGEEVSSSFERKPVHVNGLNISRLVEPRVGPDIVATIQANVDAVREADGVPHINHPNYRWAFGAAEIAQVENDRLLEIYNGHPSVHNEGGDGWPGLEEIWDQLLTMGKRIYGIAVDDAHHFQGEFSAGRENPGRGWVSVKAAALSPDAILASMERGLFYASTGVVLEDVIITPDRIEVWIKGKGDFKYTTTFFGDEGRELLSVGGSTATYALDDTVSYVRARVDDSGGARAWIQPVFVTR